MLLASSQESVGITKTFFKLAEVEERRQEVM
jgi:hypothetical protein